MGQEICDAARQESFWYVDFFGGEQGGGRSSSDTSAFAGYSAGTRVGRASLSGMGFAPDSSDQASVDIEKQLRWT
jgi:hypothetical protein